jgi:AcrR family transcriptional regulator
MSKSENDGGKGKPKSEARRPQSEGTRTTRKVKETVAAGAIARAVERKTSEVTVRRVPRQARGAATFNAILDATGRLLDEAGPEMVTTNLVAEVAGVNIATLYQYFPSKEAILLALFKRDTDARIAMVNERFAGLGEADDWRERWMSVLDEVIRQARTHPGSGSLRRAMRSSPELHAYDREAVVRSARMIASELVKRGHADMERAEVAALCILEIGAALLELRQLRYAAAMGHTEERVIEEFKEFVLGYLAQFLDP